MRSDARLLAGVRDPRQLERRKERVRGVVGGGASMGIRNYIKINITLVRSSQT